MSGSEGGVSGDHTTAIAGWKSRKEQLYRQQESVLKVNNDAEKVNVISLSKKKA